MIAQPGEQAVISADKNAPRLHLAFLDGLRGLAALYVVAYHLIEFGALPSWLRTSLSWTRYGHSAVSVFIVLSGFCLMLPVARSADGQMRGGTREYLRRRAWRILPPYYAALLFCGLYLFASQMLKHRLGIAENDLTLRSPGNWLTHLLMVHNLHPVWRSSINPVFWSVGLEWQIYFLFPSLLLPAWRRWGWGAAAAVGFAVGVSPHFLLPARINFDWAFPWYLGLFALGMAGAAIAFSREGCTQRLRDQVPWGALAAGFGIVCYALERTLGETGLLQLLRADNPALLWLSDTLFGAASACLLVACCRSRIAAKPGKPMPVLRLLEWRPLVALGTFSYSLYLMHLPAWWLLHLTILRLHLSQVGMALFQIGVGIPFAIGASYLFYRLVESRFLNAPPTRVLD